MASARKVIEVCETLAAAHPNFALTKAGINAYGRALSNVTDDILEAAADECLRKLKFFPAPSELVAEARRQRELIRGGMRLGAETDALASRRFVLEQETWENGHLDLAAWGALASDFEAAGRVHAAASILSQAQAIQAQLEVEA